MHITINCSPVKPGRMTKAATEFYEFLKTGCIGMSLEQLKELSPLAYEMVMAKKAVCVAKRITMHVHGKWIECGPNEIKIVPIDCDGEPKRPGDERMN